MSTTHMRPTVSLCTPAYNGARYIGETIESVLAQTFTDFELIVVDDHSDDDTAEIVATFTDERIRLERNGSNLGGEANWNRTIALASGRYVKLLCQDDTLYPDCLARQVDVLEADTGREIAIVSCKRDLVDDEGRMLFRGRGFKRISGRTAGEEAIRRCIRGGTNLVGEPSAVLLRQELLQQCLPFSGSYTIDLDMWFKMLVLGDLYFLPESLCTFRLATGSWSANLARSQAAQTRELFRRTRHAHPECARGSDVRIGAMRAAALEAVRRGAYLIARLRRWRFGR